MENHLSLAFFSVLIIILLIEGRKNFILTAVSFALFSLMSAIEASGVWIDQYGIRTFFFGLGWGFICVDCMKLELFRVVEERIKKRLLWKIPLVIGLSANAMGQRLDEKWLSLVPLVVILGIFFLMIKKRRFLWIAAFAAATTNAGLSFYCDLKYISSFTCVLTIYIFLRLSAQPRT